MYSEIVDALYQRVTPTVCVERGPFCEGLRFGFCFFDVRSKPVFALLLCVRVADYYIRPGVPVPGGRHTSSVEIADEFRLAAGRLRPSDVMAQTLVDHSGPAFVPSAMPRPSAS